MLEPFIKIKFVSLIYDQISGSTFGIVQYLWGIAYELSHPFEAHGGDETNLCDLHT